MNIFYDRDEWEDGTSESTWDNEGGPPVPEEAPHTLAIPQVEIYIEVHEGIPWDDNCTRISD
jgi:hypothetical protein